MYKLKIKNMLPKNHEISSASDEIVLKKMKTLKYFALTLILMDFYQPVFIFGL